MARTTRDIADTLGQLLCEVVLGLGLGSRLGLGLGSRLGYGLCKVVFSLQLSPATRIISESVTIHSSGYKEPEAVLKGTDQWPWGTEIEQVKVADHNYMSDCATLTCSNVRHIMLK